MPEEIPPPVFAGSPLDRAGSERRDPAWLAEQRAHPRRRFLALYGLEALIEDRDPPAIAWLGADALPAAAAADAILLGLERGEPRFALDLSRPGGGGAGALAAGGRRFAELRDVALGLPAGDAAILAQARSLADWHARHRFCAACGAPAGARAGGAMRVCGGCGAEHFPRVDPVVIALVAAGDRCLLVRGLARPGGSYTCIAGFMEPGETVEEAVRREVREEAGVAVASVRYRSSQPWPFPASLMLGCHAEAASEAIAIDPGEIADARWFDRAAVARAVAVAAGEAGADAAPGFGVPAPFTISHQLIRAWACPPGAR